MADETELANLKALVERLTRDNELLHENQHSQSGESSADDPMTPSGNPEPVATESNDRPSVATSATPNPGESAEVNKPLQNQAELLMEALRSVLEHTPKDRGKRLPMSRPELFDGSHAAFRLWWEKLRDYMGINSPSLPTDLLKIQTVGMYMKGGAYSWYQTRRRRMEAKGLTDDWESFKSAVIERFTDRMERRKDFQKMRDLEYKGDVQTYLATLEEMNDRVGMTGEALKDTIASAISPEMHRNIFLRYGRFPASDADLIEAVREAGVIEEEILLSATQIKKKKEAKESSSAGKSTKDQKNTKDSKDSKGTGQPSPTAKDQGTANRPKRDFSHLPRVWEKMADALKGVDQKQVDKFKELRKDCWRCGWDGHRTVNCRRSRDRDNNTLPPTPPAANDPTPDGKRAAAGTKRTYSPPPSDTDTEQPAEKRHESSAAAKALTSIWAEDESEGEITDQSDF